MSKPRVQQVDALRLFAPDEYLTHPRCKPIKPLNPTTIARGKRNVRKARAILHARRKT